MEYKFLILFFFFLLLTPVIATNSNDFKTNYLTSKNTFLIKTINEKTFFNKEINYSKIVNKKSNFKVINVTYHFKPSENKQHRDFMIAIGNSEAYPNQFITLDYSNNCNLTESRKYLVYENKFDLIALLSQQNNNVIDKTFFVKSIDLTNSKSINLDFFIEEGKKVNSNNPTLSNKFLKTKSYVENSGELTLKHCENTQNSFCGISFFTTNNCSNREPEFNTRINFDSTSKYYLIVSYVALSNPENNFFPKYFISNKKFDSPFNSLNYSFNANDFTLIKANIFDSIKGNNNNLVTNVFGTGAYPGGNIGIGNNNIALPTTTIIYALKDMNYVYFMESEPSNESTENLSLEYLNLFEITKSKKIEVYPKRFKLKIVKCNSFIKNYSNFPFVSCPLNTLSGIVFDGENKPYELETNEFGGTASITLPSGRTIYSPNAGTSFSIGCNIPYATINIPNCEIGFYQVNWSVKNVFKGSTPTVNTTLFFTGKKFIILNQTQEDLFTILPKIRPNKNKIKNNLIFKQH